MLKIHIFSKRNNLKKKFLRNAVFDYKTDTVGWVVSWLLFDTVSPVFGNLNILIFQLPNVVVLEFTPPESYNFQYIWKKKDHIIMTSVQFIALCFANENLGASYN